MEGPLTIAPNDVVFLWVTWQQGDPCRLGVDAPLMAGSGMPIDRLPIHWSLGPVPRETDLPLGYTIETHRPASDPSVGCSG